MSEEFLKSVQEYLKLDETDTVLSSIVSAAIQKCEEETGKAFDGSYLYGQAIKMLAAEWYDHRGITTTEQLKELTAPAHIQGILNQIALSSDYPEVTTK